MHNFKTKTGISRIYEINKEEFELVTAQKKPYYSYNENNELVQYAVCPICDNPIQILGFYKALKNTDKPYGKHLKRSINGLADYNQQAYDFCPYANKNKNVNRYSRKSHLTDFERNIYNLLRDHFDRVIYVLAKQIDIKISNHLAKQMLITYVKGKGWLYPWSTLNNLPWVFGHLTWSKPLFGQPILKDSPIYLTILNKCPAAKFVPYQYNGKYDVLLSKEGMHLDLNYCIIVHNRSVENKELIETLKFVVSEGSIENKKEIFVKTLTVDQTYFLNLVNLSKEKSYRNNKLIEIAKEIMPDI